MDTGLIEAGSESSKFGIGVYFEGYMMQARMLYWNTSIAGRSARIVEEGQAMVFITERKIGIYLFDFLYLHC